MPVRPLTAQEKFAALGGVSETVVGAAGATKMLDPDVEFSMITAAGATNNAFKLADGIPGATKTVKLTAKGGAGNAVLTPTNLLDGATLTFDAAFEVAVLRFAAGNWHIVSNTATLA